MKIQLSTLAIALAALALTTRKAEARAPEPTAARATATATTTKTSTAAAPDALEADLERQLDQLKKPAAGAGSSEGGAEGALRPVRDAGSGNAASRGLSTAFNPAISANGIVTGGLRSKEGTADAARADLRSGLHLQEVELQVSAIVDPYFRADIVLAASEEEIGIEEAFLSTLELPRVIVRAGQIKAAFGRHNVLHTHAFPFITAPLPWRALLGPEGLVDPGVSAEVLLPLPFFAELTAQVQRGTWAPLQGANEKNDRDLGYVGRLRTLFDLSDATTLELGGSYAGGPNGFDRWTSLGGADLTVKWRPIEHERDLGLEWTTEYLYVRRVGAAPSEAKVGGAYTSLRAQLARSWWVQGRGAVLGLPAPEGTDATWRAEALVAFVPSEFSLLRAQYAFEERGSESLHEVFLQAIFSIGSHPAHSY